MGQVSKTLALPHAAVQRITGRLQTPQALKHHILTSLWPAPAAGAACVPGAGAGKSAA